MAYHLFRAKPIPNKCWFIVDLSPANTFVVKLNLNWALIEVITLKISFAKHWPFISALVYWTSFSLPKRPCLPYSSIIISTFWHSLGICKGSMGPTWGPPAWVLSALDGPHVGPINLVIRGVISLSSLADITAQKTNVLSCHTVHHIQPNYQLFIFISWHPNKLVKSNIYNQMQYRKRYFVDTWCIDSYCFEFINN